MPSFPGVDFIDFDSNLNDEEKLVRQTARQFVDNEIIPTIEKHNREGYFSDASCPDARRARIFWRKSAGIRLRRDVQRGVRSDDCRSSNAGIPACAALFLCKVLS